ncbi:MAG: cation diffusion facilitator family transporter [Chthoniobacterales bacterium]
MSGHSHDHGPKNYNAAFAVGVVLNAAYIAVEVVIGIRIDSVALLADAGHNASDVLSLLLAWGASAMSATKPTARRTYGMRRTSILASLTNAILLLIAIGAIAWEAVGRFGQEVAVQGATMAVVAGVGIAVNAGTAMMFAKGREKDINIRGAYLHMAADAAVSAGVMFAGMAIAITGLDWIDPVVSLVIVVVIAIGTWGLLRDSVNLAIDAVPAGIDPGEVRKFLLAEPGVVDVHDLHIWAMSTTETALTAHVVRGETELANDFAITGGQELHERFEISHTTIQVERLGSGCEGCET